MNLYFQTLVIFFGFLIYLLYIEPRFAEYIILNLKWFRVKIAGVWWLINNHPKNPLVRLRMEIKYRLFIRELVKNAKKESEEPKL
jgi:hypothetical protein